MKSICMFTPTAGGGHARYAWELMTALTAQPRASHRFELVSSQDLDEQFKSVDYPVHPILNPIADRTTFANRATWIANRLAHYPRRDWQFLNWLRGRPDVVGVHFQEWTPWLAEPLFRRIKAMGKKVYYTAHNIKPHKYPKFVPKSLMDGWIRGACRLCDGLFVHTDLLAGQLAEFLGEPHPPIQVVPHGVWTVPEGQKGPSLQERLGWKRLLCFGALRRNKGVDLLLRAAEQLPGYSITIAGEPLHADYFQGEILPLVRRLRSRGIEVNLLDRFIPDEEVGTLFASHSADRAPLHAGVRRAERGGVHGAGL